MSVARVTGGGGLAPLSSNEMLVRFASAAILAALTLAAAWFGGWAAAVAVSVAVIVVHLEWIGLTGDRLAPALVFTAMLVASFALLAAGHAALAAGLTGLAVVVAAVSARELWRPAGVAYSAMLGLGLLLLRDAPEHGLAAVVVVFAVVWGTDSGAFFAGRAIGGPKLWPAVSPKKTWAGAIGGLAAGVIAGLVGRRAGAGPGGAGRWRWCARCCRSPARRATCSNRPSSAVSAPRIPATSFPATAA